MSALNFVDKIRREHLSRKAVVYVRQSTISQDRKNTGSKARQYDLHSLALKLGWAHENVVISDQDRATSGSSLNGRDAFKLILTDVALGHVGAIFCLMIDRLSRSDFDWPQIFKICQVTDTLIIDEDRAWDLNDHNDLMMMGIKGAFTASELRLIRSRCWGGLLKKVDSGVLRFRPPVGIIHDQRGQLILDPDEQVQQAIRAVFNLFDRLPSARAVVSYFNLHGMLIPTRHWGCERQGEISWTNLLYTRIVSILHNPAYAGAYVWGRTRSLLRLCQGSITDTTTGTKRLPLAEWRALKLDSHQGYISWEHYLKNIKRLNGNKADFKNDHPGSIKKGMALLQGIMLCGKCGRRMITYYPSTGHISYVCSTGSNLGAPICQSIQGKWVDAAVASTLLQAIKPAQLQISIRAVEQVNVQRQQVSQQWDLRLERARYDAELVRRHLLKVEPEFDLVTRNLRRDFNEKLAELENLEKERAHALSATPRDLSSSERQSVIELAKDLPTVWRADTTTPIERKQIIRLLIKDVALTREGQSVNVAIQWQTGACSTIKVSLPEWGAAFVSDPKLIALIRRLANDHSSKGIADHLNKAGWRSKKGKIFTQALIRNLQFKHKIKNNCLARSRKTTYEPRGDGRLGTKAVAQRLNVGTTTVNRWCREGLLDCTRDALGSPLWIKLDEDNIRILRRPFRRGNPPPLLHLEVGSAPAIADSMVSDAIWDAISPFMPPEPQKINGGRPRVSNRGILCAVIFTLRHKIAWWLLPPELGFGGGINCRRRFLHWVKAGAWQRIQETLVKLLPDGAKLEWQRTFS